MLIAIMAILVIGIFAGLVLGVPLSIVCFLAARRAIPEAYRLLETPRPDERAVRKTMNALKFLWHDTEAQRLVAKLSEKLEKR